MDSDSGHRTIYVALLDEGTSCWRPIEGQLLANGAFRIISENAEDEHWEFPSGSVVCCERRELSNNLVLVAVALADCGQL